MRLCLYLLSNFLLVFFSYHYSSQEHPTSTLELTISNFHGAGFRPDHLYFDLTDAQVSLSQASQYYAHSATGCL
ncbi:hypothetical protein M413DRAFT_32283 [Hebeloma cylindrosporum]|uniref:Uncharacterized protein n=1 Tax=Hebeloma cylindrosporum TaxID=76867 RepID=A0A0C3BWG0_HEBCY|nr:hypothetical protein M413DRAFT_32283 [Hebeloma cylindrosporum h7]